MKYPLDSDAFFEAARRRGSVKVKRWAETLMPAQVYLCPILVAEYVRGGPTAAARSGPSGRIAVFGPRAEGIGLGAD